MSQTEATPHKLEAICHTAHSGKVLDFEATPDMKHARLWFRQVFKDTGSYNYDPWLPLDIARAGYTLGVVAERVADEVEDPEAREDNQRIARELSVSAFTLFDPVRPLSASGRLNFLPLRINQPVQIGRTDSDRFQALDNDTVDDNRFIVNVNEDDILQVQVADVDDQLRLEVLAAATADSVTQVRYPNKDYLHPHRLKGPGALSNEDMVATFAGGQPYENSAPQPQRIIEAVYPELFIDAGKLAAIQRELVSAARHRY